MVGLVGQLRGLDSPGLLLHHIALQMAAGFGPAGLIPQHTLSRLAEFLDCRRLQSRHLLVGSAIPN